MIPNVGITKAFLSDFAPLIAKQPRSSRRVTETTRKQFDSIRPGDFMKLKLLGLPTVQFSGRFNSVDSDTSFWQPPSLAGKEWEFPFRPAIVASVERDVVVRKGRKGLRLSVYPLMLREEGLDEFPEDIRSRYIPLDLSTLSTNSRTPEVEPEWTFTNTYIYNTCVTLTVSVDPYLMPVSRSHHFVLLVSDRNLLHKAELRPIHWCLKTSQDLRKVVEQLEFVTSRSRPANSAGGSRRNH